MIPWASPSPQSKRYHNWFSRFRTGDRRVSLYFTVGCPSPPSKLPMGDLDSHLYMVPWAHPSPQPKQHLDRFSHLCRAH